MNQSFLKFLKDKDIKVLIFDKDGTLTDTSGLWLEPTVLVLNELLQRNGIQLSAENKQLLNDQLGITEQGIIENSIIASGTVRDMLSVLENFGTIDIEENYQFVVSYFANYIRVNPEKIITLGNIKNTLECLKREGFLLALITNDSLLPTEAVLDVTQIKSLFDFIGTNDDFPAKPSNKSIKAICEKFKVSSEQLIYIGDSIVDEEFSKWTAGFIAVTNDVEDKEQFSSAILKVKSIEELYE